MKKLGFTLAEILITLTIIGVVASLTLPALNTATGSAKNKTTLKKTIANLNNAVRTNESVNGWNFANISDACAGSTDTVANGNTATYSFCAFINDATTGSIYIDFNSSSKSGNTAKNPTAAEYSFSSTTQESNAFSGVSVTNAAIFTLGDGVVVGFNNDTNAACTKSTFRGTNYKNCFGFIDVNGPSGPNEVIGCETGTLNRVKGSTGAITAKLKDGSCTIKKGTNADIFPIAFYDSSVIPATNAVYQYLNSNK